VVVVVGATVDVTVVDVVVVVVAVVVVGRVLVVVVVAEVLVVVGGAAVVVAKVVAVVDVDSASSCALVSTGVPAAGSESGRLLSHAATRNATTTARTKTRLMMLSVNNTAFP
jgi:hypothetical protein